MIPGVVDSLSVAAVVLTSLGDVNTDWLITAFTFSGTVLSLAFTASQSLAAISVTFTFAFFAAVVSADVSDSVFFADSSVAPRSRDSEVFVFATFAAGDDLFTFIVSAAPGVAAAVPISTEVELAVWTISWWVHAFWSVIALDDTDPWFTGFSNAVTSPAFSIFTIMSDVPGWTADGIFNVTDLAFFNLLADWKSTASVNLITDLVGSTSLHVAWLTVSRWTAAWLADTLLDSATLVWTGRSGR